ncbi:hypothetical protein BJG92_01030 [Arthrobacter sp. SO5]|nr:hypothetical protein [Arthrobacter sp. SO5]
MHEMYVVTHPVAEHSELDRVGGWYDSRLGTLGRMDASFVAQELNGKSLPRTTTGSITAGPSVVQRPVGKLPSGSANA